MLLQGCKELVIDHLDAGHEGIVSIVDVLAQGDMEVVSHGEEIDQKRLIGTFDPLLALTDLAFAEVVEIGDGIVPYCFYLVEPFIVRSIYFNGEKARKNRLEDSQDEKES